MKIAPPPSALFVPATLCFFCLLALSPGLPQDGGGKTHIDALVKRITLDEKISLVHGTRDPKNLGQAGFWPGLPRLGIPPLRFADGPSGVRVNEDATAMPAPIVLASSFSVDAARQFGEVLGREAKALEQNVLLAPHVNLVRDPLFRRNYTSLGEDPLLSSLLGAAEIEGIQGQGVMAQVKHLVGYNGSNNVVIDQRTLHEIYLPPFEAAIKAGVSSVMCSYNLINGLWACENGEIQNGILRDRWAFQGFITSDWGATHNSLAITRGLDLEMPGMEILGSGGGPYFADTLKTLVKNGAVPISVLDGAVKRILNGMDRFHLLHSRLPLRSGAVDVTSHARIIREIAERGAVLLKNEAELLPLTQADLSALALIGPTARQLAYGFLTERGSGFQSRLIAPLAAMQATAPQAKISYSLGDDLQGVPISGPLAAHNGRPGLLRQQTEPRTGMTQIDSILDFGGATALQTDTAHLWTGTLAIAEEADYTFMIQPLVDNGSAGTASIKIDEQPAGAFDNTNPGRAQRPWSSLVPTNDGRDNIRTTLRLSAGVHRIEIEAASVGEIPLTIRFAWMTPQLRRDNIAAATSAARLARTAVVFAWNEAGKPFELPDDQDELIRRIAEANPRTVVVLNTGGPSAMPWKEKVGAILQMWYPGQEGGWATADLLLGRANPSGRLPITFPAKLEDAPTRAPDHPERWSAPQPASLGGDSRTGSPAIRYSEGIAVGYRWYDQQNISPLFPFGHGLSYTGFRYSDLSVTKTRGGLAVSFTISNSGTRKGAEVPQVYLGPVTNSPVPMVPRSLVGFQRVELDAGAGKTITIHIDGRGLAYWSTQKQGWVTPTGKRQIYVGSSSRDIRLTGEIQITA